MKLWLHGVNDFFQFTSWAWFASLCLIPISEMFSSILSPLAYLFHYATFLLMWREGAVSSILLSNAYALVWCSPFQILGFLSTLSQA